jgi:hypothetical protein
MTRKFWTIAAAFLFIFALASVADAQRRAKPTRGLYAGNGQNQNPANQNENPGNGNQGEEPANPPGGTPDGETPAFEPTCDDLKHGTPGLYGLCVAFCEAHDCEITITDNGDLDFSQCKKNDGKILAKYRSKMRDGDPDMPCLPATQANEEPENACPCWSLEQLSNFPYGLFAPNFADSAVECASFEEWDHAEDCNFGINYVSETVWLTDGFAAIDFGAFGGDGCGMNSCFAAFDCIVDGGASCDGWMPVDDLAIDDISYDEYLNCQAQLQQLQYDISCIEP